MNDIMKSDGLLYVATITIGLVSTVDTLIEKVGVILLAVAILALRSYVKSKETWRQ